MALCFLEFLSAQLEWNSCFTGRGRVLWTTAILVAPECSCTKRSSYMFNYICFYMYIYMCTYMIRAYIPYTYAYMSVCMYVFVYNRSSQTSNALHMWTKRAAQVEVRWALSAKESCSELARDQLWFRPPANADAAHGTVCDWPPGGPTVHCVTADPDILCLFYLKMHLMIELV